MNANSNRRTFLQSTACGFGALAFSAMASAAKAAPGYHHPPKAKRVIFLFMQGGVSQVDSFDYKPALDKFDGEKMPFDDARALANTGAKGGQQRVMKPLWKFAQHGQCGRYVSDLFPRMAQKADDLCLINSMHTEGVAHGPATLFLHCGSTSFIRPSMGSWIDYGLGTENENLPGFVSISPSAGNGGARNYGAAFLPAKHQGTALGRAGAPAKEATIGNLAGLGSVDEQRRRMEAMSKLNIAQRAIRGDDSNVDAAIESFELAARMQAFAPQTLDIARETAETHALYGIDGGPTDNFGRLCLMARRLCEAGVRYIQVTYGDNTANPAWDQHSNLPKHADHAMAVDKPIAGLLADLKRHGLLEDTIVWWGGEFGRTPYAEKNGTGRDHNPGGFSVWLAGGGFKSAFCHGATDDFGFQAISGKVHMHDLHATILHQLGLDHERLTYRYAGRDFRLTDVHGRVVSELLAS